MAAANRAKTDTEHSQAIVRLIIASLAAIAIVVMFFNGWMSDGKAIVVLLYIPFFLCVSLALWLLILYRPGVYPRRRLFAMLLDYSSIGLCLILGGETLLPLYGILLWVTVGYGMRYGSRYLALATGLALLSLAVVTWLTPYWQRQPQMVITLVITTLMVPAYAHVLLAQTRRASEQATAASLAKSRFLAQASHDLRQPIHSISLFTACLHDAALGEEERRMVDNIDRSLLGVERLFRSFLDIYTLDNGQVRVNLEVVAIDDILDSLVRQNLEAARWADVGIRLKPCRLHVLTDPNLLGTMLQNVLSNAIKYAQGRSVLIGCRRRGGSLAIQVCDQGRGIAPEHLPKVFDEFYRVRQVRDKDIEGVGLGLSIVQRLGELLGLTLQLRSTLDRGTCVLISGLPIRDARLAPPPAERTQGTLLLDGITVLLIEDDQSTLLATAALLQKWGCQVQAASTIPHSPVPCDLVITDFDLGSSVSGADCIDYLSQLYGRKVPVLVITGHDIRRVQEQLGDPDITVLAKPVRPAELRSLLQAMKLDLQRR